jgi:hypothetical protein
VEEIIVNLEELFNHILNDAVALFGSSEFGNFLENANAASPASENILVNPNE